MHIYQPAPSWPRDEEKCILRISIYLEGYEGDEGKEREEEEKRDTREKRLNDEESGHDDGDE